MAHLTASLFPFFWLLLTQPELTQGGNCASSVARVIQDSLYIAAVCRLFLPKSFPCNETWICALVNILLLTFVYTC